MKRLLPLILALPAIAHAWDFEVGAGVAQYVPMPNGFWYQKGLPYEMHLTAPALQVGVAANLLPHLDIHLDYVYLGQVSSDAIGTTDDNYSAAKQGCIGPCTKKSRFIGHGDVHGVKLSLEPHYTWRGIRFGVEAGIFAYKPAWHETMIDRLAVDGYRDGQVYDMSHNARIQTSPMFGASIGYHNVELSYQWFKTRARGDEWDALYRATHVLQVRYRF
jgi:hypothetical protein